MAKSYDAAKSDFLRGTDTDPSRGDMAMDTPRHPKVKKSKSESAQDRLQASKAKRKDHQSRALSYF